MVVGLAPGPVVGQSALAKPGHGRRATKLMAVARAEIRFMLIDTWYETLDACDDGWVQM